MTTKELQAQRIKDEKRNELINQLLVRLETVESTKEEKKVFKKLKDRFDIFSEVETIKILRDTYLPKINDFTNLVDKLEKNHQNMYETIRKFDENMCLKASKSWVKELAGNLAKDFITKEDLNDIDTRFNKIIKTLEDTSK